MRSDGRHRAALIDRCWSIYLGLTRAFITLTLREPFDYTPWQRCLWAEKRVNEISKAAMEMRTSSPKKNTEPNG